MHAIDWLTYECIRPSVQSYINPYTPRSNGRMLFNCSHEKGHHFLTNTFCYLRTYIHNMHQDTKLVWLIAVCKRSLSKQWNVFGIIIRRKIELIRWFCTKLLHKTLTLWRKSVDQASWTQVNLHNTYTFGKTELDKILVVGTYEGTYFK